MNPVFLLSLVWGAVFLQFGAAEEALGSTTRVATTRVVYIRAYLPQGATGINADNYADALVEVSSTTLTQLLNTHTLALSELQYVDPFVQCVYRSANKTETPTESVLRLLRTATALETMSPSSSPSRHSRAMALRPSLSPLVV